MPIPKQLDPEDFNKSKFDIKKYKKDQEIRDNIKNERDKKTLKLLKKAPSVKSAINAQNIINDINQDIRLQQKLSEVRRNHEKNEVEPKYTDKELKEFEKELEKYENEQESQKCLPGNCNIMGGKKSRKRRKTKRNKSRRR